MAKTRLIALFGFVGKSFNKQTQMEQGHPNVTTNPLCKSYTPTHAKKGYQ